MSSTNEYSFQNQDNKDFFTLIEEFYSNEGKIDIKQFLKKYPNKRGYSDSVAKKFENNRCIAVKTRYGKALADFTENLQKQIGLNGV